MSSQTLTRPKPSVKRPVESWLETRQRWVRGFKEVLMDPELPEEWQIRAARNIGRYEEEIRQHLAAQGGK